MNAARVRRTATILTSIGVLAAALSITSSSTRLAALGGQQIEDDGIAPSARAQIQALLDEKETRTPAERKIDSQLLYARRMEMGLPIAPGVQTLEVYVPHAGDGHVVVNVKATVTNRLVQSLSGMTGEMKQTGSTDLELHVGLDQIEAIAEQPDVLWVGPKHEAYTSRRDFAPVPRSTGDRTARRAAVLGSLRAALQGRPQAGFALPAATQDLPPQATNVYTVGTGQGSVTAQSDLTHRAAAFRGLTGFNGAGVKVGVLSDGVEHLADAQFSGDLGAVTVLPGQTGSGDEGTAMLEIIHDLAPGAQLYFATAFTSITSFADNIHALRAAGCDIIVDDVGYYVESPFQDGQGPAIVSPTNGGIVAQAVKDVAVAGAMYFSAAGNSGNFDAGTSGTWEGDFTAGAATAAPLPSAGTFHRFTGVQDFDTLTLAPTTGAPISLTWSDPLGASANDYDIFRLNSAGTTVAASGANIQDGNDDPYEQISNSTASPRIVIVKKSTAAARFLHLDTNRGQLSVATAGSTHGHATTRNTFTFAVAAANAIPYPSPFGPSNVTETFSSDGPRRIFFLGDGTAVTPGNFSSTGGQSLTKPDFTAADGVFVSGAGDFPGQFFGTSAAAPNAAAIMALIKSQNPGFTQTQLRSALLATAIDIQAAGTDRDSGVGIVMAMAPQPGCTFTTAPSLVEPAQAGSYPIGIVASSPSCDWIVFGNSPWITIANGVGVGNGTFTVNLAANRGPGRGGSYTVAGGSGGLGAVGVSVGQAGAAATMFSQSTHVAIPDNTTVESSVTVSGLTQPATNVTVSLYLTHTFDADLTLQLIGPDGSTTNLSVENGGSANDYGTGCTTTPTTFDDASERYIAHFSAPFIGSYRPEQPLSKYIGKSGASLNGTWKLRITDSFAGDTGTLQCWSVNINQGAITGLPGDFNGNGAADLSVFRPSTGQWFINGVSSPMFGSPGDVPVPGDYNGDGITDVAIYRPSTGQWFLSVPPGLVQYGRTGDIPVPADYDGDKKTDLAVYRTTEGTGGIWYLNLPGQAPVALGQRGDIPMPGDYDGDGRADLAVYRPATGEWIVATAASGFATVTSSAWGTPGDIPVRADVDNDGKLDHVVYRPSSGTWFMAPTNSAVSTFQLGLPGDIPVAQDLDGDGYPELTVWRPATGTWYIRNRITSVTTSVQFGLPGDIPIGARPRLPFTPDGDIDGDGITDLTVFRASTGTWFTRYSSSGFSLVTATATQFGLAGDIPVPGDYDGDHHTDYAVFRPSTNVWYILQSSTGTLRAVGWGAPGDRPMPADYDGDGRTDIAVWRPSTGEWWVINSSNGALSLTQWGLGSDQPIAADFDGDGRADLAVFRPSTAQWYLHLTTVAYGAQLVRTWGQAGDVPVAADYDGDGRTDIAIYRPSLGQWVGIDALTLGLVANVQWGLGGDTPRPHDFDGDGIADPVVYRPGPALWLIRPSTTGTLQLIQWGLPSDQPMLRTDR